MFKWFRYLKALPQLLGLVRELLELVRHAEDLVAGGARGAEKKALVLALLGTTLDLGATLGIPEASQVDRTALLTAAGGVIDTVVGVLNAAGVFKHGTELPPAA